jgi:aspartate racemase
MSTTGTREIGIYKQILANLNFSIIEVDENQQVELHDTIYNSEWGIKSSFHDVKRTQKNFEKYADELNSKNAEVIILGCTEIPLVLKGSNYKGTLLIDPVTALVRGLLKEVKDGKSLKSIDKDVFLKN